MARKLYCVFEQELSSIVAPTDQGELELWCSNQVPVRYTPDRAVFMWVSSRISEAKSFCMPDFYAAETSSRSALLRRLMVRTPM